MTPINLFVPQQSAAKVHSDAATDGAESFTKMKKEYQVEGGESRA